MFTKSPKRTLTSPEQEEKIRKVIVIDHANSPLVEETNLPKDQLKPQTAPLTAQTSPTTVACQNNPNDPKGPIDNESRQTEQSTESIQNRPNQLNEPIDTDSRQSKPPVTKENTLNKIVQLITELKQYTDTVKTLDTQIERLINDAFQVCLNNNLLPHSVTLDMIRKAKDTQDRNYLTDACLSKWPEEAYKNTTVLVE